VESALAAGPGGRLLLADESGTGKTVACAALLGELSRQLKAPHFLVIVPSALMSMWVRQLQEDRNLESTIVDAHNYRYLEAQTAAEKSPWSAVQCAVCPIDFLKRSDRTIAVTGVPWDAVTFDEAHLCTVGSQRGDLLHAFWFSTQASRVVAISATPHLGAPSQFEPLGDLLSSA
jgi:SNF2 family DNA or RNA helicase